MSGPAAELLWFWLSHPRDPAVVTYRVTRAVLVIIGNFWSLAEG
jgi:hypothetical protein